VDHGTDRDSSASRQLVFRLTALMARAEASPPVVSDLSSWLPYPDPSLHKDGLTVRRMQEPPE